MNEKKLFISFLKNNEMIHKILSWIVDCGGTPYLVGGSVRDLILKEEIKDLDIEVHKLTVDKLEECLKKFGIVRLVGRQFGVLRVDGIDVDWSLPRKDSKGRKPQVDIDPFMPIEEALKRRDVAINAMAIDLTDIAQTKFSDLSKSNIRFSIIDPFFGMGDLESRVLRAVDSKLFIEDPLRFYRVMQFIGRFNMSPDQELEDLCKEIDLSGIAKERIFEEFRKLFLKSKSPSKGIRWLKSIGRLKDVMPEVDMLVEIPQREDYHPEGDVFEHTMQALDAAARFKNYDLLVGANIEELEFNEIFNEKNEEALIDEIIKIRYKDLEFQKLIIMWAILCHDLGKSLATDEEMHALGHEEEGIPLTISLIKRFTSDDFFLQSILKLVRYHLMPGVLLLQHASSKAYKRLALNLAPQVNVLQLGIVALCDYRGRNPDSEQPFEDDESLIILFLEEVRKAKVEKGPEKPVLLGRHLEGIVESGPRMGKILKDAYEIQIEEAIKDVEILKIRALEKYGLLNKKA